MHGEIPEFSIIEKSDPVFRSEKAPGSIDTNVTLSDEVDNPTPNNGRKAVEARNRDGDRVGQITYDCPTQNVPGTMIRARTLALEQDYRGQDLGVKLYEQLITLAKEKGLEGVRSDSIVQGGALATWKKLMDLGYKVEVNEQVKEKWNDFVKTFNEGKYYKEMLTTKDRTDSVFRLFLNKEV